MIYSSRLKKILQITLEADGYVRVEELAKRLKTSSRTIFRELQHIDEELKEYHVRMISKAGKGICMEGSAEDKEALYHELNTEQIQYLNKEERQHLLIFELLRSDEVQKLLHYGALFQVSEATISNDLDSIEHWFSQHDLSLIRKPGVGVEVQGEEAVLRKAMTQILQEHLQKQESYGRVNFLDTSTLLSEIFLHQDAGILNMLNQDILKRILEVFHTNQHELNLDRYAQASYIGLIIHLVIAVERILKNEELKESGDVVAMVQDDASYQQAQQMAAVLEMEFDIDIPEVEIAFIALHIRGAKISRVEYANSDDTNLQQLRDILYAMLKTYDEEKRYLLLEDEELFQGLLTHLSPTITRLQHDLPIYNPLLSQIQREYKELYEQTKRACTVLEEYCGVAVSDAEAGFITMHIGASLERGKHTAAHRRVIPIGVVCASGIGVSAMLSARIQKSFHPDVRLQVLSMEDVLQHAYEDTELLVSTFALDVTDRQVIVVTPLLNQQDIQHIRLALKKRQELPEPVKKASQPISDFRVQLQLLHKISEESLLLLDHIHLHTTQQTTLSDILMESAQYLGRDEITAAQIREDLQKREAMGSVIMQDLHFALLHALTPGVDHMEILLQYPQTAWDEDLHNLKFVAVMVLHTESSRIRKELLSVFSRGLVESEPLLHAVIAQDQQKIEEALSQLIMDYIDTAVAL
ncbi:transcription antiterminator [[Clostridium] innocuum]|nr:transcription antiterminator [[Clostridium] innocuum]